MDSALGRSFAMIRRKFSSSASLQHVMKLTRLRVIDNSLIGREAELAGKPAKCIHVYNHKGVATIGDKVLVTVKGEMKRGYITGCVKKQAAMIPKFDTNNVVLVETNGTPTGTRIRLPIPSVLRGKKGEFTKIIAIATKFV